MPNRYRWERHSIIRAGDIMRRIQEHTTAFGTFGQGTPQRIFHALNEREAHAMTAQLPYAALMHHRTQHVFNEFPGETVTRVNEMWDVFTFVGRDNVDRRDGAREAATAVIDYMHEVVCALRAWFPNNRYRPVQVDTIRNIGYMGSERTIRRARFIFSYLISDTEQCAPQSEPICLTGSQISFGDNPLFPTRLPQNP